MTSTELLLQSEIKRLLAAGVLTAGGEGGADYRLTEHGMSLMPAPVEQMTEAERIHALKRAAATSTEPTAPSRRTTKVPVPPHLPFAESVPADVLQQIIFGTRVARSVAITDPEELPGLTAKSIWFNIECYLANGDWPDRRRSAAEIDAEELMAMTPAARNRAIKALAAVSDVT